MVVTMLKCGSKHLSLSLSLLNTINAMEDWKGKGSVFLPLTPIPLELWVFFSFYYLSESRILTYYYS